MEKPLTCCPLEWAIYNQQEPTHEEAAASMREPFVDQTPEQWLVAELRKLSDKCRQPFYPSCVADRLDLIVALYEAEAQ